MKDRVYKPRVRYAPEGRDTGGVLRGLAARLAGGAAMPLLPVARTSAAEGAPAAPGDPATCDYWRHCAIDGFLCGCCGGSATACPPGTQMSPVTWIGTCRNPADGRDYLVSYNDCCGKGYCGRCFCNRNEGDRPVYMPGKANDYNWCVGSKAGIPYHSTVSRIVGVASK